VCDRRLRRLLVERGYRDFELREQLEDRPGAIASLNSLL
jgi:hypothetical protein